MQSAAASLRPVSERLRALTHVALLEDADGHGGARRSTGAALRIAERCDLTTREVEILTLLVDGFRVSTIARSLHLSDGTVRNYLSSIFGKVGVRNQAELLEHVFGADGR